MKTDNDAEIVGELTAHEIEWGDAISKDRKAVEDTVRITLQWAANYNAELGQKSHDFWKHLKDRLDLNPDEDHIVKSVRGRVCVVKKDKRDD